MLNPHTAAAQLLGVLQQYFKLRVYRIEGSCLPSTSYTTIDAHTLSLPSLPSTQMNQDWKKLQGLVDTQNTTAKIDCNEYSLTHHQMRTAYPGHVQQPLLSHTSKRTKHNRKAKKKRFDNDRIRCTIMLWFITVSGPRFVNYTAIGNTRTGVQVHMYTKAREHEQTYAIRVTILLEWSHSTAPWRHSGVIASQFDCHHQTHSRSER